MPNVSSYFSVGQVDRSKSGTSTTSVPTAITSYGKISIESATDSRYLARAVSNRKDVYSKSFSVVASSGTGLVVTRLKELERLGNLVFEPTSLIGKTTLNVSSSGRILDGLYRDSPEFITDKSGSNAIGVYGKFFAFSAYNAFHVQPKNRVFAQNVLGLYTDSTISGSASIQLVDENPFLVIDKNPDSQANLVNPESYVEFTLLDESSGIDENSVNISIDGIPVIVGGDEQPGSWSLTKTVQIAGPPPNGITYRYTPTSAFAEGKTVVVDIFGQDFASPDANVTDISYAFTIWNALSFPGSIEITPDTDSPYLTNMTPASGTTNVPVCETLSFDVLDDTTGIDLSYLQVFFNGQVIFSGSTLTNQLAVSPIAGGYHIDYNLSSFEFGSDYSVRVKARDRYKPNYHYLDTSYSFSTVPNDTLSISNFFISDVGSALVITPDTEISVDITDSTYGIDITGSKIFINDEETSFNHSSITDGYRLTVNASVLLDQTEFIHVLVRAQNLRDVECPVYKEQDFKLTFGYKVTVLPEKYYKYNENVYQLLSASSIDRNTALLNEPFLFTTHPITTKQLDGLIDTRRRTKDLGAYIAPVAPRFYYNKTITVRVEAKDLDGNEMTPFEFTYKIENKPE